MARYEGLIEKISSDGKAEVLIRPGAQGIVGAPEVSKKVCHRASDGSFVRTQASNRAGGQVGDWVTVIQPAGVLKKNAMILLGTPVAGIFGGLVIGMVMGIAVLIPMMTGGILGVMSGIFVYRSSEKRLPVITRVLKTRKEVASMVAKKKAFSGQQGCDTCTQCLK
jgi:hypothetical protein